MASNFTRKKWEDLREIRNHTAVLKTASYDLGAKELAFTMTKLEPGQSVEHHNHGKGTSEEGAEEVYFLMEGKSRVQVNDHTYEAEAIELFYFPPETRRSVYNNSNEPAIWIFLAPMRMGFKKAYEQSNKIE